MKTKKFFVLFAALLPSIAFAQLKVNTIGLVGINGDPSGANLCVQQGTGRSYGVKFNGINRSLYIVNNDTATAQSTICFGERIISDMKTTGSNYGLWCSAKNTDTTSGKTIVITGICQGGRSGYMQGVTGSLYASGYGAGICGVTDYASPGVIDGRYAGYFRGNVKVTGTIDGTLVNSSDARLKENVQALDESLGSKGTSILEQLDMLTPVSFNYKKIEEAKGEVFDEEGEEEVEELPNPVMEKEHFGLIAQELQKVYPNLVYEKDNGYLAVNYVELVPVLM